MKPPADPLWMERQSQMRHESRAEYIKRLYENIRWSKRWIYDMEHVAATRTALTEQLTYTINFERNALHTALQELRNVLKRY